MEETDDDVWNRTFFMQQQIALDTMTSFILMFLEGRLVKPLIYAFYRIIIYSSPV